MYCPEQPLEPPADYMDAEYLTFDDEVERFYDEVDRLWDEGHDE